MTSCGFPADAFTIFAVTTSVAAAFVKTGLLCVTLVTRGVRGFVTRAAAADAGAFSIAAFVIFLLVTGLVAIIVYPLIVNQRYYNVAKKRFIHYISVSHITTNPDALLALLVLGALGIYAEFLRPGAIFPGVCGSCLVLLAWAGFPHIKWHGTLLLLLAFSLFVLEARVAAHGIFTVAGAVLMPAGMLLMNPGIHAATAVLMLVPFALLTSFLISSAVRARRNKTTKCSNAIL